MLKSDLIFFSVRFVGLDSRTRNIIEETRALLQSFRAIEAAEREKLETRLNAHNEQQNMIRDQKLVRHFLQNLVSIGFE